MSRMFSMKKSLVLLGVIFLVFIGLRLFATGMPYHQDEYKWVLYAHPEIIPPGTVPHPPLTEFIYTKVGPLVGDNNFRFIPLTFSIANFFLIFWLGTIVYTDRRSMWWVVSLFTISFFSLLASVMVDVDGSIMPFFLLLMAIGYYKARAAEWRDWRWLTLLVVGALGGFLIKVSALLPVAAFAFDYAIEHGMFNNKKKILRLLGYGAGVAVLFVVVLIGSKFIFPFFKLQYAFTYWEHFVIFKNRGWLQTGIQFVKSILYASPLLIVPVFLARGAVWKKTRPFFLFIFLALIFYLVLFDFSIGALDRYMQFLVVPLCIISGGVYAEYVSGIGSRKKLITFATVSFLVFCIQFIFHSTPPLYPKVEWIQRAFSLRWNFLFPFTGGSGPTGFYVSFLFMAIVWLGTIVLITLLLTKKISRVEFLVGVVVVGLTYNAVFIEEYMWGKINGSSAVMVREAAAFVARNQEIEKVTVYNDAGGFDIMQTNKYLKRLYIDPKFDVAGKINTLNANKFYYMVVDIPHIDSKTVYAKYFSTCSPIFTAASGKIQAFIYDCRKAPDLK